jgi:anti-sigma factor RsiW
MNTIEERLWNYIDGTCSDDEKKAIDILIAQDDAYRLKYQELSSLDQQFSKMEFEEPSMAFTYNVMENIRAEHAQKPLKAVIDQRIIKGISIFFIFTIVALLVFALSTVHLGPVRFSARLPDNLKIPDIRNYLNGPVLKGFLFFDLVLGLFLFDAYLRRRSVSKQG